MNQKEFKEKVIPISNKLYRFALRMLENSDDAKDILQEVFMKLWELRDSLHKLKNLDAFVMTITKNNCLDKLKTRKIKVNEKVLDNLGDFYNQRTPQKQLEEAESINRIQKIINTLPHLQKMIIQLKDIEGYSFEEIRDITGLQKNAIRVNLFRARTRLKQNYNK